jgi:hypothetical protein
MFSDLKLGTYLDRLMLQSSLKTIGPTKRKQKKTMLIEILTYMYCIFSIFANIKWHVKSINWKCLS